MWYRRPNIVNFVSPGTDGRAYGFAQAVVRGGEFVFRQRLTTRSTPSSVPLIFEVTHYEPHCPSCGSEMKVVAFITEHEVVDAILRHLRRRGEGQRERGPPRRSELVAVS